MFNYFFSEFVFGSRKRKADDLENPQLQKAFISNDVHVQQQ